MFFYAAEPLNLCRRVRGGGYGMGFSLCLPQPHSSICLMPLWLAALKRPSCVPRAACRGWDVSDPPQKNRGVMRPFVAVGCGIPLLGLMGSLTSSFIPAGRPGTAPTSWFVHGVDAALGS